MGGRLFRGLKGVEEGWRGLKGAGMASREPVQEVPSVFIPLIPGDSTTSKW